jgi:alkylation response protein AidB-like acyl-CoA dehydrogenase
MPKGYHGRRSIIVVSMLLVRFRLYLNKHSIYTLAGTAWIDLVDVKVPVENLVGEENKGFKILMGSTNISSCIVNNKKL